MTIYGTPGGQPTNTSGFQGTTPGQAPGASLPGLPPSMSIMAAVSAGLLPMNALITNFGLPLHALGDSIGAHLSGHGIADGAANIAANGGSLNVNQTGNGNSAGGSNVNQIGGQGNASVECTANMPATVAQAGLSSPVNYIG